MSKFQVTLLYDASEIVEVEADDVASAMEAAYENSRARLCHHCATHLDLGDVNKVIVCDESGEEIEP